MASNNGTGECWALWSFYRHIHWRFLLQVRVWLYRIRRCMDMCLQKQSRSFSHFYSLSLLVSHLLVLLHDSQCLNWHGSTVVTHFAQAIKYRLWFLFFTTFFCGCLETLGWSSRLWSSFSPLASTPFQIQYAGMLSIFASSESQLYSKNNSYHHWSYTSTCRQFRNLWTDCTGAGSEVQPIETEAVYVLILETLSMYVRC